MDGVDFKEEGDGTPLAVGHRLVQDEGASWMWWIGFNAMIFIMLQVTLSLSFLPKSFSDRGVCWDTPSMTLRSQPCQQYRCCPLLIPGPAHEVKTASR